MPTSQITFRFVCFLLTGLLLAPMAHAQDENSEGGRGGRRRGGDRSFDAASFLKRLDRNGDGVLEGEELSGRTRDFVERQGMDPNKPIKLDELIKRIESGNTQSSSNEAPKSSATSSGFVRKVPGFGIEGETTGSGSVPTFVSGGAVGVATATLAQFSESTREQVESTLRRYDKNGNRQLDPEEIQEARWGQPSPAESDLNRDGVLSQIELATRNAQRERAVNEASGSSSRSSQRESRRSRDRSDDNSSSSNDSPTSSSGSGDSRDSGNRFASSPDRFRKYAEGILQNYDQDKDGKLSKDEFKEIRRPPANADGDGDGFVTAGELADAYARASSGSSSSDSSATSTRSSDRGSSRSSRDSSERSRGSSSNRFSFNTADVNGDGQVQMHEFTDEWTDEKLMEFNALDRNRDGVITRDEAAQSGG